jgi:release factor glutamine methyltransferase
MATNGYLVTELIDAGLNRREARWLVEEFMPGDHGAIAELRDAAQRRMNGEPLQYIIGHWPFRMLDLVVDPRVLIPRPESEELVGVALAELDTNAVASPTILDLGCGSGAIGLSLLFELAQLDISATLVAVDESSDALVVARENASKHGLEGVTFVQSSWFDELDESLRGSFDLIVANPPYVSASEFTTLDPVLRFEPLGALVAEDSALADGFADVEQIIRLARSWLSPLGLLICEHGNMQRAAALQAAHEAQFTGVRDLDDMYANPRFLVARP